MAQMRTVFRLEILNIIDSEYRRRLGKKFQGLMTVLHFEKKLTSAVTFAEFLKVWKVIKKNGALECNASQCQIFELLFNPS